MPTPGRPVNWCCRPTEGDIARLRDGTFSPVTFTIELEREDDGRWLAEVDPLPGVMCYGQDRDAAVAKVQALALRVIAERLESRLSAELLNLTFEPRES